MRGTYACLCWNDKESEYMNDTEPAIEPQDQPELDGVQRCEFDSTSVHRQTPPSRQREIPGQHFIHPDRAAQLRRPRDGN